ncbi:hypothetical protein ILUMI_08859 [Ignelater luminosus]|uniref:MD-2-related lipid-recognition domain-containing protein n=1 Tax=Ignelater luminosus TaxID=2038154 RepID=A0A8K0GA88_IGNLU|nr:hypothetical protein ILUMI_08859 [Ignelater luminosus]
MHKQIMVKIPLFILLVCFHLSFEDDESPIIDISTLADCEDQKVPLPEGFTCETEISGEGESKVLNAQVAIPFDVDNTIKYKATIKKWIDEKWQPLQFFLSGSVCEHVHKYLPGLWEKLSKFAGVPQDCPIKAGSYSVKGFTIQNLGSSDVKLPVLVPGKYLVSVLVIDKTDTPITCKQSELTISKKHK